MSGYDYDLVVIGSGPAGQRAAIQASKLGKHVAVVEREPHVGGINVTAGMVSKTMRDAALYLTGYWERNISQHGQGRRHRFLKMLSHLETRELLGVHRGQGRRTHPHRPGGHRSRRYDGLLRRGRERLSDPGRVLHDGDPRQDDPPRAVNSI